MTLFGHNAAFARIGSGNQDENEAEQARGKRCTYVLCLGFTLDLCLKALNVLCQFVPHQNLKFIQSIIFEDIFDCFGDCDCLRELGSPRSWPQSHRARWPRYASSPQEVSRLLRQPLRVSGAQSTVQSDCQEKGTERNSEESATIHAKSTASKVGQQGLEEDGEGIVLVWIETVGRAQHFLEYEAR